MAVNYHQPSVNAVLDAMPKPLLTFGVNGQLTYCNAAAKAHPGNPAQSMAGKPVIKSLASDIQLGKVKLPYAADVELDGGLKVKGRFLPGLSGLDTAFLIESDVQAAAPRRTAELSDIIALLRDEVGPPLRKLSSLLGNLPPGPDAEQLESAAAALDDRLRRLADLIAVFGDELLVNDDRIELPEVIASVCAEFRPKAQAKKVVLEVIDPEQTLPPLYGNSRIIRRAICECIDNAITHSRREVNSQQNLEVRIQYFLTGEHVLITVRNQGAIPEDKGIEVREAFAPASAPGNGRLGLPLVNRIVGLHGGNMRITSSVEDEVRVMLEFPTGAPQRGHDRLDLAQVQRYATDLAQLMSRRRKEPV